MGTFLDDISADITDRFSGVVENITELMESNSGDALFRRFRASYAKLSVEDIAAAQNALGHIEGESTPCRGCRLMAQKELELDDIG